MPFTRYPASEPFEPATRAVDLLTTTEHFGDYWQNEFGDFNVFYVRGTETFRRTVVKPAAKVNHYIRDMQKHLKMLIGWGADGFDWYKDFSKNQVGKAWDHKPRSFDKAAKVILLCGVTAEEERDDDKPQMPRGADAYAAMQIQPAVYIIHGFDAAGLERLQQWDSGILQKLKENTGQRNPAVFIDMSQGLTVTLPLATKVQTYLRETVPSAYIGDIDIPAGRQFSASNHETLDLR